jgi:hypothetical protein
MVFSRRSKTLGARWHARHPVRHKSRTRAATAIASIFLRVTGRVGDGDRPCVLGHSLPRMNLLSATHDPDGALDAAVNDPVLRSRRVPAP